MANRVSAGAFIIVLSLTLLAPLAAQARSGGFGGGPAFHGGRMPAVHVRPAPRVSFGHNAVRRFDVGRHLSPRLRFDHRFAQRHHRGGYGGYGTFPVDAISVGSAVPYPAGTIAPYQADPAEPGVGGPLVLRHVCQSEVQIVPATRGGEHEVTVTRCRLFAQ